MILQIRLNLWRVFKTIFKNKQINVEKTLADWDRRRRFLLNRRPMSTIHFVEKPVMPAADSEEDEESVAAGTYHIFMTSVSFRFRSSYFDFHNLIRFYRCVHANIYNDSFIFAKSENRNSQGVSSVNGSRRMGRQMSKMMLSRGSTLAGTGLGPGLGRQLTLGSDDGGELWGGQSDGGYSSKLGSSAGSRTNFVLFFC